MDAEQEREDAWLTRVEQRIKESDLSSSSAAQRLVWPRRKKARPDRNELVRNGLA